MKFEPAETSIAAFGAVDKYKMSALPPQQEAIRAKCFHPKGRITEFPREDIETSIAARFEKIAALYADRVAVKTPHEALTYEELNKLANRIAHAILARRNPSAAPIALLFKQDIFSIAAVLGVLKAGRSFVPIDYSMPSTKLRQILNQVEEEIILTDSEHLALARELADESADVVDVTALNHRVSTDNPKLPIPADGCAYIYFTSGSTGTPKGVIALHRNEIHNIYKNHTALHISPDDRVSLLRSHNVGAARDIFLALLNGATLCSLDLKDRDLRGIGDWLIDEAITVFTCVTTIYRQAVQNVSARTKFPDVRLIHVGGELVSRSDVEFYQKHFSDDCVFVVRYSISETPAVSYYFIDKHTALADEQVPVGYALDGNEVVILDEKGKTLASNVMGEIAIRSPFLAPGYWRQPDLTRTKFLADSGNGNMRTYLTGDLGYLKPDGCLVHMGRKDFLVKVRGFRIETGEVESALRAMKNVRDVAVVATLDGNAETQLIAYVVPKDNSPLSPTTLRRRLREKLSDYMIPQSFVMLKALPLTVNGKIDRKSLPDPGKTRLQIEIAYMPPATAVEKSLAQIWAEVLDLSTVGIHDDFVELGGHSLLATRIIGKINETFGIDVSIRSLLDASTIAELAAIVTGLTGSEKDSEPYAAIKEEIGEI